MSMAVRARGKLVALRRGREVGAVRREERIARRSWGDGECIVEGDIDFDRKSGELRRLRRRWKQDSSEDADVDVNNVR
jgi:hypothetical protein